MRHVPQPVGVHEVMVESYFARHADAVDAMLLTARLSGVFAAFAWQYSTYVENQMPCLARKDRWMSPEQIVTSVQPNWSKIKVFGCGAYELIPNNKFAKYPGTARQKAPFHRLHAWPSRSGSLRSSGEKSNNRRHKRGVRGKHGR